MSAYAKQALEKLGVTVHLGNPVTECHADGVEFGGTVAARQDHHLGSRRAGVARGEMAECTR